MTWHEAIGLDTMKVGWLFIPVRTFFFFGKNQLWLIIRGSETKEAERTVSKIRLGPIPCIIRTNKTVHVAEVNTSTKRSLFQGRRCFTCHYQLEKCSSFSSQSHQMVWLWYWYILWYYTKKKFWLQNTLPDNLPKSLRQETLFNLIRHWKPSECIN